MAHDEKATTGNEATGGAESNFARRVLITLGLTSLFAAVFLLLAYAPDAVLLTFAAVWFGCVLRQASDVLTRWTGLSRRWTLAAVVLLIVGLTLGFFALFGWQLAGHFDELSKSLTQAVDRLSGRLDDYPTFRRMLHNPPSPRQAVQIVSDGRSGSSVATLLTSPFGWAVNVLFVFFTGLYLAGDAERYTGGAVRLFPVDRRPHVRNVFGETSHVLWQWTLARLASMAIIGAMSWVGLWALGIPMATTLAVLTGLLVFIPNVGPILSLAAPMLLALTKGPWDPLWVLLLYAGIQFVESWFVTPLIHQREDDLPAAVTIVAQLVLGVLFGLLGVMFAMPIMLVTMLFVQRFYVERGLEGRAETARDVT